MKTITPRQRIRRWHTRLVLWKIHHVLGIGAGLFIVIASLSGSLLVVHHQLERTLFADRHLVPPIPQTTSPPPALAATIRTIAARAAPPDYHALRVEPGLRPDDATKLVFTTVDRRSRWSAYFDPATGHVLWSGPDQSLFTPWLLHLHMHLHLGPIGYLVMSVAGLALTLLSISGIWITRGRLRVLLRAPWNLRGGWHAVAGGLHRWSGLVGLYFCFVLGATGVWFAIRIVPGQLNPAPPPAAERVPFDLDQLAPLEPLIALTRARWPEAELFRINLPREADATAQIRVLHRDAPVWQKFSRLDFDPVTGTPGRVRDAHELPWSDQFQSILAPLHFGFYGSPVTQWLYAVGGLTPALLSLTGFIIWWQRRRA